MPTLQAPQEEIKRFVLPSTKDLPEADQAWVDLDIAKVIASDMVGMDGANGRIEASLELLLGRIRGWNFTDATGASLPITVDNLKLIDALDYIYLTGQIGKPSGLPTEEKKS